MKPEEVTLVVPCYNVADTLPRVLASIDHLEPPPSRVVCIDDGSTDGTEKIVRAHGSVELVAHSENRGLGAALNTALLRTETPGMAKIDADIVVERDWLGKLCTVCESHDADLVQGRFEEETTTAADRWREVHLPPRFPDRPLFNKPLNGANILCRTDALQAVGGWNERYRRAFDDIDLFERLITAGYRVYYTPDVLTTHLRTDTWEEVLRTAWAYHHDSVSSNLGRQPPERPRELVTRTPPMLARATKSIVTDIQQGNLDLLGISLLRPLYHLAFDVESVREENGEGTHCLGREQIEYGDVTLDIGDEVITPWIKRLICRGYYEHEEAELVGTYLESGSDVIELGAGIGYLSCFIDGLLDRSTTQIAVEPNEQLVSLIERNRELNDGSYELVNAAYSTREGPVELYMPDEFWGGSLLEVDDSDMTTSVEAIDLGTLFDRYDLSEVSLVVDIEGSEIELIENELDLLESRCTLLIVEFHPEMSSSSSSRVEQVQDKLTDTSFERIDRKGTVEAYRPRNPPSR